MKLIVSIVLLFVPFFSASLSGQDPLEDRLDSLRSAVSDTSGLEFIIDLIERTRYQPEESLLYISVYEEIIGRNPTLSHRLSDVIRLKGARYNQLAWSTAKVNKDLAILYLDTSQYYYDEIQYELGSWNNKYGLATIHRFAGENEKALSLYDEYYEHFLDPFDSIYISNVQFQRGVILQQLGKYEESARCFLEAYELDMSLGRTSSAANNLNSLAITYKKAKLFDQSEKAYEKALQTYQSLNDTMGQARVLLNTANLLIEEKRDKAKGFGYYYQVLQLVKSDENLVGYVYENLGNAYLEDGQIDSSSLYLKRAYDIKKNYVGTRDIYPMLHKLGKSEMAHNRLSSAERYLLKAYDGVIQSKELASQKDIASDLSKLYEIKGNYPKALEYSKILISAKDSLLDQSIANSIAELNTKYETEQKEKEIQLLSSQNELQTIKLKSGRRNLIFTSLGLLALVLFSYFMYRSRRNVTRLNEELQAKNLIIAKALREKDTLLREIHHRVKNNLQVISSLLGIQSRQVSDPVAKDALNEGRSRVQSMSLIHQDLYQQDNLKGIYIKDYFDKLTQSLYSTYTVSKGVKINADIDPLLLDVDTVIPLGLIINELVTNALKYAFVDDVGTITVSLKEHEGLLRLIVADDGMGIEDVSKVLNGDSYGYELIQALVDKLEGHLEISVDNGSKVIATFRKYQKAA